MKIFEDETVVDGQACMQFMYVVRSVRHWQHAAIAAHHHHHHVYVSFTIDADI